MSIKSTQFSDAINDLRKRTMNAYDMIYITKRMTDVGPSRLSFQRRIFLIYIYICIIEGKKLCADSFIENGYTRSQASKHLSYFTVHRFKVLYRVAFGLYNYNTYAEHIYENFYKALRDKYSHIADCLPERLPPPPVYL